MKTPTQTDIMIDILEDAVARSDEDNPAPKEFNERKHLSLVVDLIEAKHIRGDTLNDKDGIPRGAAMWGITLSGREYLVKLKTEREAQQLPAKLAKIGWTILGWLMGIITAAAIALVSLGIEKWF